MVMKPAAGRSSLDRSKGDKFEKQKVTLGKKKCTCDFDIKMGTKCSGTAKCDKKCSGTGTVEIGGCSFKLAVKKGKGKISGCACAAQPTEAPAPTGTGSGSGETPVPMPGSGSGSEPMPPTGGSGSGAPAPGAGEGMQCACKCTCPDGSGECDCDCNCPMTSKAVTCAEGFSKVCPMMEGQCPADMDVMCPNGAMSRMAGGNGGEGSDKGCMCVPDFLMAMVMKPAAGRSSLDRSKGEVTFKIKKTTCKCSYMINAGNCQKSKFTCDKKCNGNAKGVEVEDGMYVFDLAVKKGKVKVGKCKKEEGSGPTGTGGGNGGNGGAGSGSGNGGEGAGASRCACVSKGMGGTGPSPPTGSGSGPAPTGSGSGSEPAPPTGSGSGSGSETPAPAPEPIGTVTRVKLELFTGQTEADEPISFDGESLTLPSDTQFDPTKPIKVVTHGWHQSSLDSFGNVVVDSDEYPRSFNQLYMDSGYDYTVLGVHWVPIEGWNEDLQTASSSDAANTLGRAMHALFQKYNVSMSQVHMIGFSMGTVVTSKTAKKLQDLGNGPLGRLTLLDPCPYHQANDAISKTDGVFVEAIHTSSQGICSETPLAHVDYYPNGGDAQPCGSDSCSCPDGGQVCPTCYHGAARCRDFFGNPDWFANHFRAVELYRESIGSPSSFQSWKCSKTYEEFVSNDRSCPENNQKIPMGEHSVDQGRPSDGLYFLTTAGVSPYSA